MAEKSRHIAEIAVERAPPIKNKKNDSPNKRKNTGASEVVGTLLLVSIGVSLFALLAIVTFTLPSIFFSEPTPSTNIIGRVKANTVVFEHYGGRPLPLDTKITVMFAETPMVMTVGSLLDASSKADGQWNIGEKITIVNNDPNLPIMLINAMITDTQSNTVVMRGVIQEGSQAVNPSQSPYMQTQSQQTPQKST